MINEKFKKLLEFNPNKNDIEKYISKSNKVRSDIENISLSDILDTTTNVMLKRLYRKGSGDTELKNKISKMINDSLFDFILLQIKSYTETHDSIDEFFRYRLLDIYLSDIISNKETLEECGLSIEDIDEFNLEDKIKLLLRLEPSIYKVRSKNKKLFKAIHERYDRSELPFYIKETLAEVIGEIYK